MVGGIRQPDDIDDMPQHDEDSGECANCGGEGLVWGCFEDTCSCGDSDGLGCSPTTCDWCGGKSL